ncbi:MAG: FAD-dependent oxidoreductase, partial [Dehalococcoidales bacterium]|nr:FAD-dependent oxidoreductase [Dehalococcoidales bacterium]
MSGEFSKLLEPGRIGTLELKNRIIMPPMGNRLCGVWGEVTDPLIEWYRTRAKGGVGMIIVEATHCATAVDPIRALPRVLRADDTCYISGLTHLVEAIHENGAKAAIQLSPGTGAQAKGGPWSPGPGFQGVLDIPSVSPSGVPALGRNDHPRTLTADEIRKMVELMAAGSLNVKRAGFDMIEVHAHGGYLIGQFMSPYFNKRTDEYGGSFDNRCRFLMEMVAAIKKALGRDFPLTVKYSITDELPGGWDIAQSQQLAVQLEAAGVDAIGISSGVAGSKLPIIPPYPYPPGAFLQLSEAIKKVVKIPVIAGGRLNDPKLADKAIREGKTDFVLEGRALITDPEWPNKVAAGKPEQIRPCLACNECLENMLVRLSCVRCAVNVTAARETDFDLKKPADVKKKVLIAGAGPAGMEAARIAAIRGHEVILCEKNRQMGGLTQLGGIHNEQISAFSEWLASQIKSLSVEVRLQTEVTPALVEQIKPDAVIVAVGGKFVKPQVPGITRDNVFSAQDLLNLMNGISINKGFLFNSFLPLARKAINAGTVRTVLSSNFPIKKNVAVIGGQFPGSSLALFLAEKGKKVTVIEEAATFGNDIE